MEGYYIKHMRRSRFVLFRMVIRVLRTSGVAELRTDGLEGHMTNMSELSESQYEVYSLSTRVADLIIDSQ